MNRLIKTYESARARRRGNYKIIKVYEDDIREFQALYNYKIRLEKYAITSIKRLDKAIKYCESKIKICEEVPSLTNLTVLNEVKSILRILRKRKYD